MITAHPSKVDDDWLYGRIECSGRSGTFPKAYVEEIQGETMLIHDGLEKAKRLMMIDFFFFFS